MTDSQLFGLAARCGWIRQNDFSWEKTTVTRKYEVNPNRKSNDVLAEDYFLQWDETGTITVPNDATLFKWLRRYVEVAKNFGWSIEAKK